MWVTGWVRDRDSGREAAMGATIFVGLARQKWWGPVVLDADPKPASDLNFLRERPLQRLRESAPLARQNPFPYKRDGWHYRRRRGSTANIKEVPMARSKPSALDALRKLREQRAHLDSEEERLRQEAASELGKLLIECGAETIEPSQLRQVVRATMALGIEETLKRIAPA
jgi:hypothetical protein